MKNLIKPEKIIILISIPEKIYKIKLPLIEIQNSLYLK